MKKYWFVVLLCIVVFSGCSLRGFFGGGQAERQRYIIAFEQDMSAMVESLIAENVEVLERFGIICNRLEAIYAKALSDGGDPETTLHAKELADQMRAKLIKL